jgi:hypothetical protein
MGSSPASLALALAYETYGIFIAGAMKVQAPSIPLRAPRSQLSGPPSNNDANVGKHRGHGRS